MAKLSITVLLAVRNEAANIETCLRSLTRAERIVVLDSNSSDGTIEIAERLGAEVVQFKFEGGYPKKRQWAIENVLVQTEWVMLIDADEEVPASLWDEIEQALRANGTVNGYLALKGFWFMGHQFRHGGFSHRAVLLYRRGKGNFEKLDDIECGLDMEVHERMIVEGKLGTFRTPLTHHDKKGLTAYIDRHNRYSVWEAAVRSRYFRTGTWGGETIRPRLLGNIQERRRWIKQWLCRMPGEPLWWFLYHYVVRLGFLEGRRGLIASQQRAHYIANVRAKIFELEQRS